MQTRGMEELKEYLGDSFTLYYDSSWALAHEWNEASRSTRENVELFYQQTSNYLYNLVVFYESGDRKDFKPFFKQLATNQQYRVVIDYGCGVGNDSLDLVAAGFQVIAIDFDSPSLDFLRWRLGKRGIPKEQCEVISIERLEESLQKCQEADVFWGVDVLEHMYDPFEIFHLFSDNIKAVAFYIDSDDQAGGRHPFHFTFPKNEFVERLRLMKLKETVEYDPTISVWVK